MVYIKFKIIIYNKLSKLLRNISLKPQSIHIANRKDKIVGTNFWELKPAQKQFYLSWDREAKVGRLLLPQGKTKATVVEINKSNWVEIEQQKDKIALYFYDDFQEFPFEVRIDLSNTDRTELTFGPIRIDVYSNKGCLFQIDGEIMPEQPHLEI
ncbi:MAG: hypothetical protein QM666_09170 [Acinetobacter sp.]